MIRKMLIMLVVVMFIGTMLSGCVDKEKSKNAPTQQQAQQQQQQEQRNQRNQQRDSLNPYPMNRVNSDGTKG